MNIWTSVKQPLYLYLAWGITRLSALQSSLSWASSLDPFSPDSQCPNLTQSLCLQDYERVQGIKRSYLTGPCREILIAVGSRGLLSKVSGHTRVSFCWTIPQGLGSLDIRFVIQQFHRHWLLCVPGNGHQRYSASLPAASAANSHFSTSTSFVDSTPSSPYHTPFKVTPNHSLFLPRSPYPPVVGQGQRSSVSSSILSLVHYQHKQCCTILRDFSFDIQKPLWK